MESLDLVVRVEGWSHDQFRTQLPSSATVRHLCDLIVQHYGHMKKLRMCFGSKKTQLDTENSGRSLQECGLAVPSLREPNTNALAIYVDFIPLAPNILKVASPLPAQSHASAIKSDLMAHDRTRAATALGTGRMFPAIASGSTASSSAARCGRHSPQPQRPSTVGFARTTPSSSSSTTTTTRGGAKELETSSSSSSSSSSPSWHTIRRRVSNVNRATHETRFGKFYRHVEPKVVRMHPDWTQPRVARKVGQLFTSGRTWQEIVKEFYASASSDGSGNPTAAVTPETVSSSDGAAASTGGQAWGRFRAATNLPLLLKKKSDAISEVALSLVARIKNNGGSSDQWLKREWANLAVHTGQVRVFHPDPALHFIIYVNSSLFSSSAVLHRSTYR